MRLFLLLFYPVQFKIFFVYWFGCLSLKNKKRLDYIMRTCMKIAGIQLNELTAIQSQLHERQRLFKQTAITLSAEFKLLPSGHRYALPGCRTNRFKDTFEPVTIGLLNSVSVACTTCVLLTVQQVVPQG